MPRPKFFFTGKLRLLLWFVGGVLAFGIGRHAAGRSVDFIVYYRAARSLLAGRTDLYSSTFAWGPPMIYVYPPLFLLLVFPLGWLSFANAFGVWFALEALAIGAAVWHGQKRWGVLTRPAYALTLAALAVPYVVMGLKYGNAHLFVVVLTVLGVLAWARDKLWLSSAALSLGGAIKLFPLLLVPVFLVRREWRLAIRVGILSCAIWLLPALHFGPRRTALLYRKWYRTVIEDIPGFAARRALNQSFSGTMARWFTRVNYWRLRRRGYPEVTLVELPARVVRWLVLLVALGMGGSSLWMCAQLRKVEESPPVAGISGRNISVAIAASVFVAAQLVLGPYTPVLYLSGWLLVGLALPAITGWRNKALWPFSLVSAFNVILFAVPGTNAQRTIQASGAFTMIGVAIWILVMAAARNYLRKGIVSPVVTNETTYFLC
jgi:hypothetical protein